MIVVLVILCAVVACFLPGARKKELHSHLPARERYDADMEELRKAVVSSGLSDDTTARKYIATKKRIMFEGED